MYTTIVPECLIPLMSPREPLYYFDRIETSLFAYLTPYLYFRKCLFLMLVFLVTCEVSYRGPAVQSPKGSLNPSQNVTCNVGNRECRQLYFRRLQNAVKKHIPIYYKPSTQVSAEGAHLMVSERSRDEAALSAGSRLKRVYLIVGRNQCKLKMDNTGFVYGSHAESITNPMTSHTDEDLFWFLPVAPGLVFIKSLKTNRWLCVQGRNIVGSVNRDRRSCLFWRHKSSADASNSHWDNLCLYNSITHLRVSWFPAMGSFCAVQAVSVKHWREVKHPEFFAFLTVDRLERLAKLDDRHVTSTSNIAFARFNKRLKVGQSTRYESGSGAWGPGIRNTPRLSIYHHPRKSKRMNSTNPAQLDFEKYTIDKLRSHRKRNEMNGQKRAALKFRNNAARYFFRTRYRIGSRGYTKWAKGHKHG